MRLSLLLLLFTLSACEPGHQQISIPFDVQFNGAPISCESEPPVSLTDLRFYVHDLELVSAAGDVVPARPTRDTAWQNGVVALVDLENGMDSCANGTPELNSSVRVNVGASGDLSDFRGLRFTLGVPFELNHDNPLEAPPPLDDSAMHWHWRSGYKFLRAGVETMDDGFWFHLGSTACNGTTGNIAGCDSPNRPRIEVAGFRPGRDGVIIDIGRLFNDVNFEDGVGTDCSSGPTEASCPPILAILGLDKDESSVAEGLFVAYPMAE